MRIHTIAFALLQYVKVIYTDGGTHGYAEGGYTRGEWVVVGDGKRLHTGQGGVQMETGYAMRRYPQDDEFLQRDEDIHGEDVTKRDEDLHGDVRTHSTSRYSPSPHICLLRAYAPSFVYTLQSPLCVFPPSPLSLCNTALLSHLPPCILSSIVCKKVRVEASSFGVYFYLSPAITCNL